MSLRETEKRLTAIYSKARADIGREWYKYMQEIEGKTSALYDRLREARRQGNKDLAAELTKEYQDAVKSSTILNARYRAMVQDTTAQLKSVTDIAYAYINGTLPETYAGAYNKLGDVTAGINGYTFSLVDADTVRNLAMNDKTLLPYKVVNGEKFERWNTKIINSQLMQGILQGESIPTMAKRLENATEMTRKAAIRNARTMTTSAENKGRNDSYKRADDDGIIMVKGWICAIDGRTRYEHIHADGQEVGVNEAFSVGGEKLDYPGDPKGSPQNIYNCRCTMKTRIVGFRRADGSISYVKDGNYSGVRAVKGKDGKTVFVDKAKAEELKQEYLPKPLISEGGSGIIKANNTDFDIPNYDVEITDKSIESISHIDVEGFSEENNRRFVQAQKDILNEAKHHPVGTEVSAIYNADTMEIIGDMIVGKDGAGSVRIADSSEKYFAFHNHPDRATFSPADVWKLLYRENMSGIVATGNDGSTYLIKTLENVDIIGYVRYINNALDGIDVCGYSYSDIKNRRVDFSKIGKEKFYTEYTNAIESIWKESEKYGFRYVKKIPND